MDKDLAKHVLIQSFKNSKPNIEEFKKGNLIKKENDTAFIFVMGGPIYDGSWKYSNKTTDPLFGKSYYTIKNLYSKKNINKKIYAHFNLDADLFYLIQPQWKGIKLENYFSQPLRDSQVDHWNLNTLKKIPKVSDFKFLLNFSPDHWKKVASQILEEQIKWLEIAIKQLKLKGYKTIHLIGHSYGGYLINRFIQKGNKESLDNLSSLSIIASRIPQGREFKKYCSKTKGFPFFVYSNVSKKYSKIKYVKPLPSAATKATILSQISYVLQDALESKDIFQNLSLANKKKIRYFYTDYDTRTGAFNQEEISLLKKHNIFYKKIETKKLEEYRKYHMWNQLWYKKIGLYKKPLSKGIDYHDTILFYLMINFKEWYYTKKPPLGSKTLHKDSLYKILGELLIK